MPPCKKDRSPGRIQSESPDLLPVLLSLPQTRAAPSLSQTTHGRNAETHPFHSSYKSAKNIYPFCPPVAVSNHYYIGHSYYSFCITKIQALSAGQSGCKADIRNPLRYLLMNAVASRSVSGSFQLPLTEASPLTRRLLLRALEAGECLSAFKCLQNCGSCFAAKRFAGIS